jgi:hypothetical protein
MLSNSMTARNIYIACTLMQLVAGGLSAAIIWWPSKWKLFYSLCNGSTATLAGITYHCVPGHVIDAYNAAYEAGAVPLGWFTLLNGIIWLMITCIWLVKRVKSRLGDDRVFDLPTLSK